MTRVVPTTAQERDRKQAGLPVLPLPAAPSGLRVGPFYFRPTEGTKVRIRIAPARSQQRTLWLPGASHAGGTQSSNPLCSSGESPANLSFRRIEVQGRSHP